jgi:hypothetical protein
MEKNLQKSSAGSNFSNFHFWVYKTIFDYYFYNTDKNTIVKKLDLVLKKILLRLLLFCPESKKLARMKTMGKIFLLCFVFLTTVGNAQTEKNVSTIYMNNGEVYKGKMVDYLKGEYLILERLNGTIDTIPDSDISRIEQLQGKNSRSTASNKPQKEPKVNTRNKPKPKKKKTYRFREKGWYNVTGFAGYGGKSNSFIKMGIGISTVTGYLFNRNFGLGVGLGKDNYSSRQGEGLFPVFMEVRGYFSKDSNSPFYAVKVGYGVAFENENQGITQAIGGVMLNPEVGYRLGGDKTGNIFFALGFKLQKQFIERTSTFNSDITVVDAVYKRISISTGIIF